MLQSRSRSSALKKVQCLLNMQEYEQAASILDTIPESADLEFQETMLRCLKAARPNSRRIPSLEHRVMDMRVQAALDREVLAKFGQSSAQPMVHGDDPDA